MMDKEPRTPGKQPDYRLVQFEPDENGKDKALNVGGMWLNKSKDGKDYLNMRLGNVKLICFPTEQKGDKKPPAFNICQRQNALNDSGEPESKLRNVGCIWENRDKKGKPFWSVVIGSENQSQFPLRLVAYLNTPRA